MFNINKDFSVVQIITIKQYAKNLLENYNIDDIIRNNVSNLNRNVLNRIKCIISHKDAVNALAKKYSRKICDLTFDNHDRDEIIYLILFNDIKVASALHKITAKHHSYPKDIKTRYEMIFDYESKCMTKAGKPLSAYDAILKFHPERIEVLKQYLENLDLWEKSNSYINTKKDIDDIIKHITYDRICYEIIKSLQFIISDDFNNYLVD